MRTRKIYLTGQEKAFIIRDFNRGNGGRGVNWRWIPFFVGVILALVLPFLIDFALFGNPIPCHTEKTFEDGSSIQHCEVRK